MLPSFEYPQYDINVPSLKKNYKFRPFLVKEEKLLLMAKETGNEKDILSSIKQIIDNCIISKDLSTDKMSLFDLEYIFLKLRSFSIDNIVKVSYRDFEDNKVYTFEINLDDIEIIFPENSDNVVKISDKTGITMKYPPASLYGDQEFLNLEKDQMFELIIRCIDSIYNDDEIYMAKDYKKEELEQFLENLNLKVFEGIQKFLLNVPKIEHVIKYKNELGNDREIILSSLNDFFTFR
ncbi:Baseplate hub assembly protein, bacteriophage T4-like [uncultured Caudovirales phage]|uniref:Baseplate hub assembly protein, bacteriophage T4-like n=1 Tax=uncultured Caudovirales phage TaxID=2100421 RepID=A0A6J5NTI7_9CAUD|nr:Baseplate hub assembly protein, bacteriophage T4-like [uncultured Caudovirales phage]